MLNMNLFIDVVKRSFKNTTKVEINCYIVAKIHA